MVALFLSTTISCSEGFALIQRITKNASLSQFQKTEIVAELRQTIPSCPIKVEKHVN